MLVHNKHLLITMHGMNIKITVSLSFLYKIRNVIQDTFCYTVQIKECNEKQFLSPIQLSLWQMDLFVPSVN